MIPVGNLIILDEGIWSFIKNSVANILGKRRSTVISRPDADSNQRIESGDATYRRLTPKALSSTRKLGFKQLKK